jgi:autotransporter-associated beta strand protein
MFANPRFLCRLSDWIRIMLFACALLHAPKCLADLLVELDSDAGITISGTASFTWADQAAAGGNMTFIGNTATRVPTLVSSGTPTGLPLVSFNGAASNPNQLLSQNATSLDGGPSLTWSLVLRPTDFSDIDTYLQTRVSNRQYAWTTNHFSGNFTGQVRSEGNTQFNSRIASAPLGGLASDWMILSTVYDSSAGTVQLFLTDATGMRHEGNLVTGAVLANGTHQITTLGSDVTRSHSAPMDMAALRIYDEALSASQRTAMEATLFDTYINPDYYWKGGIDSAWTATSGNLTNWTSDFEGDNTRSMLPSATSNVFFSANGVTTPSVSLASNQTIRSLTFNGTGDLDILGAHTLTMEAASDSAISVLAETGTITLETALAGSGAGLLKSGNSTLVLEAAASFGGPVTVNAGTLSLSGADYLPVAANATISSPGTLRLLSGNQSLASLSGNGSIDLGSHTLSTGTYDSTFAGSITGSGGLAKTGAGTLTLSGSNAFTGELAIKAGTINATAAGALGNGTIVLGDSSGSADVSLNANGVTWSNPIIVSAGNSGNATLLGRTGNTVFSGGITLLNPLRLVSTSTSLQIAGSGLSGSEDITVAATAGQVRFQVANPNFDGNVLIEMGTMQINNAAALRSVNAVTMLSGATLDLRQNMTIASLSGEGTVTKTTIAGGTTTLTVASEVGSSTFSGVMTDSIVSGTPVLVALTKNGAATFILDGNNTYTGATTINAGTLQIGAGGATGALGATAITNNAALVVDRTGSLELTGNIGGSGSLTTHRGGCQRIGHLRACRIRHDHSGNRSGRFRGRSP